MNYLIWVTAFMIVPLLVLVTGILVYRQHIMTDNIGVIGRSMALLFIIGYLWDAFAIHAGWWYYEPSQVVGIWLLGMPLEEYIFIFATSLFYILITLIGLEYWGDDA